MTGQPLHENEIGPRICGRNASLLSFRTGSYILLNIIKRDGRREPYRRDKLFAGILRCSNYAIADKVVRIVENRIQATGGKADITADELHNMALEVLRVESPPSALRYDLRRSIMKLGPNGFAFEDFIADMLRLEGKDVLVRVKERGKCALHELDITYEEEGGRHFIECKYHNEYGIYTGLKEAMYTYMRLLDLRDNGLGYTNCTLVTNTKVSWEAVDFSSCKHMNVIGWNFPPGHGLERTLERLNMYPVTVLEKQLQPEQVYHLLNEHIVTLRDLIAAYDGGRLDKGFESSVNLSRETVSNG